MAARGKRLLLSGCIFSALVSCFLRGVTGDVPDDVVYTDLHKTVRIGESVILTCQFRGTPLAVYWKKGYEPRRAPNLVSWIPTDNVTGKCEGERPCQIMEMNEDHSLVIKEVSIAEQGRYICRVSNYKAILIHNFTDIKLLSIPAEPYPIIKQCANDSTQVCSVSTNESIKITCSATSFYPDLDLFFLHGSQKMTDIGSTSVTNDDGTKNKSISIKASASNTPYICVASDIPGSKDQRAATIFVNSANGGTPAPSSTNAVTMEITTNNRAIEIVVPIILILVIGAVGLFAFFWCKHPHLFRRINTGSEVTGSNSTATRDPEEIIPMVEKATIGGNTRATTSDPEENYPKEEKTTSAAPPKTATLNLVETYDSCSLYRPHDVILHAGTYVITDTYNGRIICLSASNEYSVLYKSERPHLSFRPFSIAALSDTEHSFLITDKHNKNVFQLKSKELSQFSSTYRDFHTPTGITLNRKRDRVYIADNSQNCILEFDMDGTYLGPQGQGSLFRPLFIACNSHDIIYVTDKEGIKVFDREWRYLTTVTINIKNKTWCYRGIAIDTCDNIFITARSRDNVITKKETVAAINANHLLVKEYTGGTFYHLFLSGVCIDYERNRVVVVNGGKHTIATYTLY